MNGMQEWLARAAEELGVRVEVGYAMTLANGRELTSQALFPALGNRLGTLVFSSRDAIDSEARRALASLGYSISSFGEPLPAEAFDIDGYAEMFAEWGWAGKEENKPIWMLSVDE
jgi:cobalamin biosynthesis protein CobT